MPWSGASHLAQHSSTRSRESSVREPHTSEEFLLSALNDEQAKQFFKMSQIAKSQVHRPMSGESETVDYQKQEPVVHITHGTSFDDLDLQDIVDPFLLSPRLPYPSPSYQNPISPEVSLAYCRSVGNPSQPVLHLRSRSLGSVVTASPHTPPRIKLPPIPIQGGGASEDNFDAGSILADSTLSPNGVISGEVTSSIPSDSGVTPTSFLSTGHSSTESRGSVTSEDDISQKYHTAPASPVGVLDSSDFAETRGKPSTLRLSGHRRQSSSTSTIRLFFKRGLHPDSDNSDSETDSDVVATPTDPLPKPLRLKRRSSLFKVLDRLKSGM